MIKPIISTGEEEENPITFSDSDDDDLSSTMHTMSVEERHRDEPTWVSQAALRIKTEPTDLPEGMDCSQSVQAAEPVQGDSDTPPNYPPPPIPSDQDDIDEEALLAKSPREEEDKDEDVASHGEVDSTPASETQEQQSPSHKDE